MALEIEEAAESALHGNWAPLLDAAREAPGKHWAEDARCAGRDINLFFPGSDTPWISPDEVRHTYGLLLNRPLNLCADCPLAVAARCLVEALRQDARYGIRGGLLASERSALHHAWKQRHRQTDTNKLRAA
ncbi:WhiB family transcriptional regulator [Streptomyces tubercidicus]|uniref:WhiB family transcriptional regulator n=1 Tax=Streptomyces tubercidicus TaxID=47759 RepID=UPI0036C70D33